MFCHTSVATELLKTLVSYEEVQQAILMGLIGILKANDDGNDPKALLGLSCTDDVIAIARKLLYSITLLHIIIYVCI